MRWLNRGRSVAVSAQHHPIRTNLGGRERSREGGREGREEKGRREGGKGGGGVGKEGRGKAST